MCNDDPLLHVAGRDERQNLPENELPRRANTIRRQGTAERPEEAQQLRATPGFEPAGLGLDWFCGRISPRSIPPDELAPMLQQPADDPLVIWSQGVRPSPHESQCNCSKSSSCLVSDRGAAMTLRPGGGPARLLLRYWRIVQAGDTVLVRDRKSVV